MRQGTTAIRLGLIAASMAMSACATSDRRSDAELQRALETFEEAAAEFEAQMSDEERAAFHREVEQHAILEMQARAANCGTKLHFSNEAKFEDRSVFVDAAATPEQLVCIQKSYPFVKAAPR